MKVAYGVCVGSWEKLQRWVVPHAGDRPLMALVGQTSITAAYNTIIDAYQDDELDALILQHDDHCSPSHSAVEHPRLGAYRPRQKDQIPRRPADVACLRRSFEHRCNFSRFSEHSTFCW